MIGPIGTPPARCAPELAAAISSSLVDPVGEYVPICCAKAADVRTAEPAANSNEALMHPGLRTIFALILLFLRVKNEP